MSEQATMSRTNPVDVTIVGGGMITNDLILPSIYHLQRLGVVGRIGVCARQDAQLRALRENRELRQSFPGQEFDAYPPLLQRTWSDHLPLPCCRGPIRH
jgi:hypothetical protein